MNIVEQYYMTEDDVKLDNIQYKTVSVKIRIQHECQLRAICDRFGKSLSVVAGEIIEEEVSAMFLNLSDKDIVELGDKADVEAGKFLAERGFTSTYTGLLGDTVNNDQFWGTRAVMFLNHKKEQAKKENKKAVAKS